MENPPIEHSTTQEGDLLVVIHRSLNYEQANSISGEVLRLLSNYKPRKLLLDFSHVAGIDSAGIALLKVLERYCHENRIDIQYLLVPSSVQRFLDYSKSNAVTARAVTAVPSLDIISRIGKPLAEVLGDFYDLTQFIGLFTTTMLKNLLDPKRLRWRDTLYFLQASGAESMPILVLLSFLMGLVIAFQAAVQLRQFGANIYVADLVSLSITRELGPLLTAVILAGRSGSSFAAELGTMKVNEEVDALIVMGFDITEYLVVPKVNALTIAAPLLTLLADASGILGGVVVGYLGLDITFSSFMQETYEALTVPDVVSGLIKSVVFAFLIALIGCFRGLQTEQGADSVGRQTTSAVVSGIFLIIVSDAIFTVIFQVFDF